MSVKAPLVVVVFLKFIKCCNVTLASFDEIYCMNCKAASGRVMVFDEGCANE